jgi:Domain of unknown function (DUF3846)
VIKAVLIPCAELMDIIEVPLTGDLSRAINIIVDGHFELLRVPGKPQLVMYGNTDAKMRNLPLNRRATIICQTLPHDVILGNVICVGSSPTGREIDCPMSAEEIVAYAIELIESGL